MSSPVAPHVLVIDDGELGLARALLVELSVEYEEVQASRGHAPAHLPSRLLVTTAPAAASLRLHRTRAREGHNPTWLAFVEAESRMQNRLLRDSGFDLLVPNRVHPGALRLLLARGSFAGDDTQRVTRVAFGGEISFGPALRRRKAVMIELSPRGCRFLTSKPPKPGARFTIQIPRGGRSTLELEGTAMRLAPGRQEGGLENETAVGFRFLPLKPEQVEQLKGLLIERLTGPLPLRSDIEVLRPVAPQPRFRETAAASARGPRPAPVARGPIHDAPTITTFTPRTLAGADDPTSAPILRSGRASVPGLLPRAHFDREVSAICAGGTRVLLGRNLSEQGILVERNHKLTLGERVRVVIHAATREEPVLAEACVARDDGERGLLLRFDVVAARDLTRLRRLIDALPKIRRLVDDTPTHTAFLTELLPALKR